jgi:hypothetical protein
MSLVDPSPSGERGYNKQTNKKLKKEDKRRINLKRQPVIIL